MPKIYFRLFKIQAIACLALVFSLNVFGQNDALKNDLSKSFKKFDIVRINPNDALQRQVMGRQSLTIATAAKTFELNLIPNDIRSSRYRAEAATAGGGVRSLEKGAVTTYKGMVGDENNSVARMTIDDEKIEGFFDTNGERYFIEPANRHSAFASKNDFVVFRQGDFLNGEGFSCFSETEEKIEKGTNYIAPFGLENLTNYKVIELATEADSQYVSATGGSAATNSEILSILNMVEGMYQNELGLTINVVYQHTWETQDPYNGSSQVTLLDSFKNHWNANFPASQYPRDTAHLWTGKMMNQGRAVIAVVCNPTSAYGFSGRSEWQEAKTLIAGHEIGHNLGANHAESAQSCDNTLMNAALSTVTPLTFCSYSRSEISNYVTPNGGCLAQQTSATRFDFDGDNKADITVFRPENGAWYINKSAGGFSAFQFGQNGDKPVSADYDGDGKTDVAVFRPSNGVWYRLNSSTGAFTGAQFGTSGDVPVAGDYDGDAKADINLFRPANGVWYRLNSANNSFYAAQFGVQGDKAVSGDFDGDGKDDLAVWRPSNGAWYILRSLSGSFQGVQFGTSGDVPTPADFDGDGKTDVAVFRPSNGVWYRLNSSTGAFTGAQFGVGSDLPAQSYYIR